VPDSQVIKNVVYHMIYPKKDSQVYGVPRFLLIDNGKEFTAQTLTGRSRKVRFNIDGQIKGFYRSIGIEDDLRSLPYTPWDKAQLERFFYTLCKKFTDRLDSYVGSLTTSRTSSKVRKDIPQMLKEDKLISIEEFSAYFEKFINETYHMGEHKGLKRQKEESPVPLDVFLGADRYYKPAPPEEYARMQLLEFEERVVGNIGIQAFNRYFQNEALGPYIGQTVCIRYEPGNYGSIHVYDQDGIKICQAFSYEGLDPLATEDDQEFINHIKEQNRQITNVRIKIEHLQTSAEKRKERKVILPELEGKDTIVAMPDDKQYRQEKADKKKVINEFYERQAEKAKARLAKII